MVHLFMNPGSNWLLLRLAVTILRGGAAAALSSAGWYEADSQSRQNQPHMTEDGYGPYITYKSISVRGSLPGLQIF